eukprot:gnl/MRDRNA2_/MRDRNA2_139257_c0_seq1.p1 gnl/MRDRNA2_/MRDRNA2_139257_c0~~gnl/MRDRNA2_/MRDRNA2_139257_c0_seq1.p1  ORF type:complete len:107 (-),score=25.50 gnl/MRDRNA2_/MRDRNA2_139257_c0_seq1:165-485(-)
MGGVCGSGPVIQGKYECKLYDEPNDWHFVEVTNEGDHFLWTNKADVSWMLTPEDEDELAVDEDCGYYDDGYKICKIVKDEHGTITGLMGPGDELYEKVIAFSHEED